MVWFVFEYVVVVVELVGFGIQLYLGLFYLVLCVDGLDEFIYLCIIGIDVLYWVGVGGVGDQCEVFQF